MRLNFTIGCCDRRKTSRRCQNFQFSRIEALFADHVHRRSRVDNKFGLMVQTRTYFPKMRRMLFYLSPSIFYFRPSSTLLYGHLALATLPPPEADPQNLERWSYADEVHLGKLIRAKDFGLDLWSVGISRDHNVQTVCWFASLLHAWPRGRAARNVNFGVNGWDTNPRLDDCSEARGSILQKNERLCQQTWAGQRCGQARGEAGWVFKQWLGWTNGPEITIKRRTLHWWRATLRVQPETIGDSHKLWSEIYAGCATTEDVLLARDVLVFCGFQVVLHIDSAVAREICRRERVGKIKIVGSANVVVTTNGQNEDSHAQDSEYVT